MSTYPVLTYNGGPSQHVKMNQDGVILSTKELTFPEQINVQEIRLNGLPQQLTFAKTGVTPTNTLAAVANYTTVPSSYPYWASFVNSTGVLTLQPGTYCIQNWCSETTPGTAAGWIITEYFGLGKINSHYIGTTTNTQNIVDSYVFNITSPDTVALFEISTEDGSSAIIANLVLTTFVTVTKLG